MQIRLESLAAPSGGTQSAACDTCGSKRMRPTLKPSSMHMHMMES